MTWYLIGSALAGFAAAIGHSYLSATLVLRPLFAAPGDNRVLAAPLMRRVIVAMFYLPSLAWTMVAAATVWLLFDQTTQASGALMMLASLGGGLYLVSAIINLWIVRRPHVGNILLTFAAAGLAVAALSSGLTTQSP